MGRKSSSSRWKQRQARDPFVRRAQAEGWRSRAVFKLQEIDDRERLLRRGALVVDLGAAPGGWSQLASGKVGATGVVIAIDLLPMEPLAGAKCIRGDFTDEAVLDSVMDALDGRQADLVLSDMAPNMSGNWSVDQPRSVELVLSVLDAARRLLKPGGSAVIKVFQGEGFEALVRQARGLFEVVRIRKPAASRSESREMYLVAVGRRL